MTFSRHSGSTKVQPIHLDRRISDGSVHTSSPRSSDRQHSRREKTGPTNPHRNGPPINPQTLDHHQRVSSESKSKLASTCATTTGKSTPVIPSKENPKHIHQHPLFPERSLHRLCTNKSTPKLLKYKNQVVILLFLLLRT